MPLPPITILRCIKSAAKKPTPTAVADANADADLDLDLDTDAGVDGDEINSETDLTAVDIDAIFVCIFLGIIVMDCVIGIVIVIVRQRSCLIDNDAISISLNLR